MTADKITYYDASPNPNHLSREQIDRVITAIELRPSCERHGFMQLRPLANQTPEQVFCGVWYDCPRENRCASSVLLPSKELEAQLASYQRG